MAAFEPAAIREGFNLIAANMPRAEFAGILANKPGYHNSRNRNSSGDYSVQRSRDRQGNGDAASALDVTFRVPADMAVTTQRMIDATLGDDPRMWACRSFFGTVNGRTVTGLDVTDKRWVTSDDSHLWHIHVSFYRDSATNHAAIRGVAEVIAGVGAGGSTPPEDAVPNRLNVTTSRPFALTAGQWRSLEFENTSDADIFPGPSAARIGGRSYLSSLAFTVDERLPLDGNVWTRTSMHHDGAQIGQSRSQEHRGTTGTTAVVDTRAGWVGNRDARLRVQVSATHNCQINSAQWSLLYW